MTSNDTIRHMMALGYTVDVEAGTVTSPHGKVLKPSNSGKGGLVVGMDVNGQRRTVYLRRIVAYAIWGERVLWRGAKVWHKDGNSLNCRGGNLVLGGHKGVMRAAAAAGKLANNGGSVSNKVTDEMVANIRADLFGSWHNGRLRPGEAQRVGAKYGLRREHVSQIAHFKLHRDHSGLPPLPR
jgi:hypothetical protein